MAKKLTNEEVFVKNSYYARHLIKRRILEQSLLEYICAECGNKGDHNGRPLTLQLDHINGEGQDHRIENLRFLCPNCHSQTDTYAGKASTGKRNYINRPKVKVYAEKLKKDRELWELLKSDETIEYGKWGWKTRLSNKIGIKSQKVTQWIKRVYPEFLKRFE